MDKILIPVLIVAGIGLLAGIILAVASAIMAVPKDEKAEAILEVLPGANCGACGFSGCSGYAAALSKGEAQPGLCSPGGEACAKACAELLGTGDVAVEKKTALVHCMGSYDCTSDKMRYDGIDSCAASTLLAGGISSCRYGCMGHGRLRRRVRIRRNQRLQRHGVNRPRKVPRLRKMHRCMSEGAHQLCAAEKAGGRALLQL